MIAFEWRDVNRKNVVDSRFSDFKNQGVASCFEGARERRIEMKRHLSIILFPNSVFESVRRTLENVTRRGRGLRDFSRRERGYVLRGRRKDVDVNVKLRKPERLEFLSLVDEAIGDSPR